MESSGPDAPNHTPAEASQEPSAAWSLALVEAVCGFHEAAVLAYPLASVTTTWDSPVVALVMRNGTPAMRERSPSETFTSSRSPRLTWLATARSPVSSTISPSFSMENGTSASVPRYPSGASASRTR